MATETISYSDYTEAVQGYNCEQGLTAISIVSSGLAWGKPSLEGTIFEKYPGIANQWQLACLARILIENSNDYKKKLLHDKGILIACDLYNKVHEPLLDASENEQEDSIHSFLIRTSYEEFPYQILTGEIMHEVGRANIMFRDIARAATKAGFNIEQEFEKITQLSIADFILIGYAYVASMQEGPKTFPIKIDSHRLEKFLNQDKQKKFLNIVMATYSTFRKNQDSLPLKKGLEKFQFNYLKKFPIIETQKNKKIVCPIPLLLLDKTTHGIFYILQEAHNCGQKINQFTQFFGKHIFEPYLGRLLRHHFPNAIVSEELDITKSEKSCDWILKENDCTTLIECKTSALQQISKNYADPKDITSDLLKRISPAIKAFKRTKSAILSNQNDLSKYKSNNFQYLIVLYDRIYLPNSPLYRKSLEKDLVNEGLGEFKFQICSVNELERVLPCIEQTGLGNFLMQKTSNPENYTLDITNYLNSIHNKDNNNKNNLLLTSCQNLLKEYDITPNLT